ncbi:MAG TPA: hypothetical protein VJN68_09800 [Burkholderiaceae bacterium]|nr:hypothetical protein [Burkholderiaceae bacterium]
MNHGYGIESPGAHHPPPNQQQPVRYVVIIDAGGSMVARLFIASRELVAEFDAGAEEIVQMTQGLLPERSASGSEWDRALAGHSAAERASAEVYTLDV